ncbi:MAG TPA: gamma-glutamyltransferase [Gaiellaceae bacterium]|nr:gamma-glutamyltransferase [Gaiellaceae bacterium]
MKGAVAAGHPLTAQTGAEILAEGGNAVDACIAAAFVSWVAESPLTGPGAGGFMLVHRASDRSDRLLDFFVAIPGRDLRRRTVAPMDEVDVEFDAGKHQVFRIGAASCAVPGAVAGLGAAHAAYARMPWAELVAPAARLAREGVVLNPEQGFLHAILEPILRAAPEGRRIYGEDALVRTGGRIRMPELAGTLERLAEEGPGGFYSGDLARAVAVAVQEEGGRLTESDLGGYRVIRRRPVRVPYRRWEFVSNPPPSAGGVLIAFALSVLDRLGSASRSGSPAAIASLAEVMREAQLARGPGFLSGLSRGGLTRRLLAEPAIAAAAERAAARLGAFASEPAGVPSTTHVSVVDGRGNAASLSSSTGCGSGVIVPGTGIHVNNMLGEEDLNPGGRESAPGRRLTSMMAPSLVLEEGRPRLVVGSAGSIRLRAAILQIIVNVLDHGMTARKAIDSPRVHVDGPVLHLEGGVDPEAADALEAAGYEVVRWNGLNLYFGGASAVGLGADGGLEAAGDPRRGGGGAVVQ